MSAADDDPRAVARSLLFLADVLEARTAGLASYGILRRAAQLLTGRRSADDPRQVARLLLALADRLEYAGGAQYTGILRRGARMLVAIEVKAATACPVCGAPVDQPSRGRRRIYCSTACRNRESNAKRNVGLAS